MKFLHLSVLFCAALTTSALAAAPGTDERWNLSDLYASVDAWHADATKLEGELKDFAQCKGHLGESVQRFKRCLDLNADMNKRLTRMFVYSSQKLDEDTANASSLELNQRAQVLGTRFGEETAFVNPELLTLGRAKVDAFLAQDASLKIYRHPLDDVLRMAPHTLDRKGEELVASFGLIDDTPRSVYGILSDADMPWPTIKLSDGEDARLDQSGYTKYRALANRDDRKRVFEVFWGKWKEFERTFGVTFYSQMKTNTVYSKVRKYPDSITSALDANRLPVSLYDTLIKETNANLPTLHRYFKLRARMLGVKEMHYYDIYPNLVQSDLKFPYAQAKELVLDSMKPLGDDYVAALKNGLESHWMDLYPRPHKRSGAHMAGSAYDVHPFVLINYNDDYESVSTVAHEWGHAMHSYLSNRAQPYVTSEYATFIAEIASTLNEALLLEHMLKVAKDDNERLLYLGSALEGLRGTFFRQAMFAEFEREVHARVDKGESLSGEALTKIYGDILRRYHGDKEGVLKIDDAYTIEWAYIPHFYRPYYVYQYATSIAASSQFAQDILSGKRGAKERYLDLLRSGSADYPYELVKKAGVDLASPAPYRALVARMNKIMDEIEAILAKKGK